MLPENMLLTQIQGARGRADLEMKRKMMIEEALSLSKGTLEKPHKHLIARLANGLEVYFLKPGKEVANVNRPNPNDMTPIVGNPTTNLRFDEVWTYLSKISSANFERFKAVLAIVYRNAYLLDHVKSEDGVLRYRPSQQIVDFLEATDKMLKGVSPFGLVGLLHFLDILGWNEDVKYHVESNQPTFSGHYNFNVGRINTLLTCIRVPYQASAFVKNCVVSAKANSEIDFMNLYSIMQQFAKSRGTCTPTKLQLRRWLSPYVA